MFCRQNALLHRPLPRFLSYEQRHPHDLAENKRCIVSFPDSCKFGGGIGGGPDGEVRIIIDAIIAAIIPAILILLSTTKKLFKSY